MGENAGCFTRLLVASLWEIFHGAATIPCVAQKRRRQKEGDRRRVAAGDVVVVPAGTQHNFVASTGAALKLFTIYTPPHHRPGAVRATKADADEPAARLLSASKKQRR